MNSPWEQVNEACERSGSKLTARVLHVSIARQQLTLLRDGRPERTFTISTSLRAPSCVKDSLGTPTGLHEIAERIGHGQPPGTVFVSRVATGHHFSELSDEENKRNLVTTRILWLRGREPGVNRGGNVDSYDRYIYVHGTNHEDRIGQPASAGCVLLRNLEMIELFDTVRNGDLVLIAE